MKARTAKSGLAAIAVSALALAACSSGNTSDSHLTCPAIVPAPGADTIALFGPGGHAAKDVVVGGKIYGLDDTCVRLKVGIEVNAEISLYAQRASMDVKDATFPYFVALVDPDQKVLTEESFQVPVQFLPAEAVRRVPAEKITIRLPLKNVATSAGYSIVVGFQLTPDQIAFNRGTRTP